MIINKIVWKLKLELIESKLNGAVKPASHWFVLSDSRTEFHAARSRPPTASWGPILYYQTTCTLIFNSLHFVEVFSFCSSSFIRSFLPDSAVIFPLPHLFVGFSTKISRSHDRGLNWKLASKSSVLYASDSVRHRPRSWSSVNCAVRPPQLPGALLNSWPAKGSALLLLSVWSSPVAVEVGRSNCLPHEIA